MIWTNISIEFFISIGAQTIGKGKDAKQEGTKSIIEHRTYFRTYTKMIEHPKGKVKIDPDVRIMDQTHSWTVGRLTD